jgi:hypothetical protein
VFFFEKKNQKTSLNLVLRSPCAEVAAGEFAAGEFAAGEFAAPRPEPDLLTKT